MKCLKNGYRIETSRNRHFRFVWLSIFKKKKKEKKGTILHIRYCFMRFFFSTIHYMRLIRSYRIDSYRCELTAMYVHAHQTFVWINRSNLCIIFYMGISLKAKCTIWLTGHRFIRKLIYHLCYLFCFSLLRI